MRACGARAPASRRSRWRANVPARWPPPCQRTGAALRATKRGASRSDVPLRTRRWRQADAHAAPITALAIDPAARRIGSASGDGTARLWRADTGDRVATLDGHRGPVDFVSFSRDGRTVLTAGRDATARLWEAEGGRPLKTFRVPEQFLDPIHAFNLNHHGELSADGRHLVTVTSGDRMMVFQPGLVWDVEDEMQVGALRHEGAIYHIALAGGDRWVLTTSYDHTAKLWDVASGKLLRTFSGHQAPVLTGVVYADGRLLV